MKTDRRAFLKMSAAALATPTLSACGGSEKIATPGIPLSPFDEDSTAELVTNGIDLKGKIAVVTGCTSGIGYETMRVLAQRGCYVVGTGRTLEKAQAACSSVVGITTPLQLELSDFESVVACAEAIRSMRSPIDILVCNAGYRGGGNNRELINGVEKHFLVNHLGHFLLTNRILDRMMWSWQGRIVVVASRAAYGSAPEDGLRISDLSLSADYSDSAAYGQSKLANVLFAYRLGELLKGTRVTANSLHPGVINTEIDRNVNGLLQFGFGLLSSVSGKNIEEGAATSCYVATSPHLGAVSGEYFEDCNPVTVVNNPFMRNMTLAEELFRVSEQLTAEYLVEVKPPDWDDFENGLPKNDRGAR